MIKTENDFQVSEDLLILATQHCQSKQIAFQQKIYQKLKNIIGQINNFVTIFTLIDKSHHFLFMFCEILSKQINMDKYFLKNYRPYEFDQIQLCSKYHQENGMYEKVIVNIFHKMHQIINKKECYPNYLINCVRNLIVACLKDIIVRNNINENLFKYFIEIYFEGFNIRKPSFYQEEIKLQDYFQKLAICEQKIQKNYVESIKILIDLIDSISSQSCFQSYYDFQNFYLSLKGCVLMTLLQISYYYLSHFYQQLANIKESCFQDQFYLRLCATVRLFEALLSHPFCFKEASVDQQYFKKTNSEIILPNYYKNLLFRDPNFMEKYTKLFYYFSNLECKKSQDSLRHIISIITRLSSISTYSFNNQVNLSTIRKLIVKTVIYFLQQSKCVKIYYLHDFLDLLYRIINKFNYCELEDQIKNLTHEIFLFGQSILNNCQIFEPVENENIFNKLLGILRNLYEIILMNTPKLTGQKYEITQYLVEFMKNYFQQLLQCYFKKIVSPEELKNFKQLKFSNYNESNKYFENMFRCIPYIYLLNLKKNLQVFANLQLQNQPLIIQNIYIRFYTSILKQFKFIFQEQEDLVFEDFILKIFFISKNRFQIFDLHFIQVFINNVICEYRTFKKLGNSWKRLVNQLSGFQIYLNHSIIKCIQGFINQDQIVVQYSLNLLESIYSKQNEIFSKFKNSYFTHILSNLIGLDQGCLGKKQNIKIRKRLYEVVTKIWINKCAKRNIYLINNILNNFLYREFNIIKLFQYFYDCAGVLTEIHKNQYENVAQVFIDDFHRLYYAYFPTSDCFLKLLEIKAIFKGFVEYCTAFLLNKDRRISELKHSKIMLQFYKILVPIIKYCAPIWQKDYFFKLYRNLLENVPTKPLFSLPQIFYKSNVPTIEKKKFISIKISILNFYFNELHRYQNIDQLYPLITQNYNYMKLWYNQKLERLMQPPVDILKQIIILKKWRSIQQKQIISQIILNIHKKCPNAFNKMISNSPNMAKILNNLFNI